MYTLSINMWFQKIMKQFFFGVDQVVYNFISTIYDLLITIARTSVLSQADILDMADRIYKLLTVFMIFKVTFSLIMYVVNPDDFSDKSKGVGKLGTNIIISLSLLVLTPYIFNMAYKLQTIILEDNSLATLIFGQDKNCGGETGVECKTDFINSAGDKMTYIIMSAFFTPDTSLFNECINLTDSDGLREECFGFSDPLHFDNTSSNANEKTLAGKTKSNSNFKLSALQNYAAGILYENFGLMFRQEIAVATDEENELFIMDYKYIFSTVVGVVVVLLLLTFCMDVAVRSIKLAFLQLAAPIPIISYIDPKSGKDGLFKKWYQMCFKTYLSLFIRLLSLYFAIYIISRVADLELVDIVDGTTQTNTFVAIFIIIGALMFAKQLPEILKGLGINLDGGGFTLNPFKKISDQALGGKKILGATKGLAAGAMIGTAGMMTGAGKGRALSAMFGGVKDGIQGKKFGEIRKDQASKNAEMRKAIASGSTFSGRTGARISSFFGTPGELGDIEHDKAQHQNRIDDYNIRRKAIDARNEPVRRQIQEKSDISSTLSAMQDRGVKKVKQGVGTQGQHYQSMLAEAAALESQSQHETNSERAAELARQAERMRQKAETYANTEGRDNWINENMERDIELRNLRVTYDQQTQTSGIENIFENPDLDATLVAENIDSQGKSLSEEITAARASIAGTEQEIKLIDEQIKTEQEAIDRLGTREKVIKSDYNVTHSTEGGPSNPKDIRPSDDN